MYHVEHHKGKVRKSRHAGPEELLERCLQAFVAAGTLDLSLDQLARKARSSKRMLVHYFRTREGLEEMAIARLEERLRARFSPAAFAQAAGPEVVLKALWDTATAPQARGLLLLIMDVSRRAWSGSERAKAFYLEQRRLWVELLLTFLPDPEKVEDILQLFQGALLVFLISGDPQRGERALMNLLSSPPGKRE
jgi:AcrR family transcriptional regulator